MIDKKFSFEWLIIVAYIWSLYYSFQFGETHATHFITGMDRGCNDI